ncbi:MAG: hypothetical protein J2P26_03085 [Nocardiopsaceae bacterium]|nr:hypothetical protein [Nocardiopsaceae bacterium]
MPERVAASGSGGGSGSGDDYPLNDRQTDILLRELARIYGDESRARTLLRAARFPNEVIPSWTNDALTFWSEIFQQIDNGVAVSYRRLLDAALATYPGNPGLASLNEARRPPEAAASPPGEPEPAAEPTCHLVLRVHSEEERASVRDWLAQRRLHPRETWSTPTAVSFELSEADPDAVRALLAARPDLGWTLVPPGAPDYVLRFLYVEGPDGRSFRFSDVPSSTRVGDVGEELIEQYHEGLPGRDNPLVIDRVDRRGNGHRANPDNTLDEEDVTDGSTLRVGFQRRAAAVNPLDRRDALFGVRNQMQEYVDGHPGFEVWPNSPALPTEYDIGFTQPSFGPPPAPGDEPPGIEVHELSITLGPDFPVTAPRVRWLTGIFHPNVFPTYECERLREHPHMRGAVCLGTLEESYQPSLHFGDLCATLRDIAGYRNYSVFVPADDAADPLTGQPVLRGDYYDRDAAMWAISAAGQERIAAAGGAPVLRVLSPRPPRYGFEIEPGV